jgi:hypothetical protein
VVKKERESKKRWDVMKGTRMGGDGGEPTSNSTRSSVSALILLLLQIE